MYDEARKATVAPPPDVDGTVNSDETAVRASDGPAETRIQRKIRELEEAERLRYYHVSEYKVKKELKI